MKANYHTHTPRCNHAVGPERSYVERALTGGFEALGFSDHTPYFFDEPGYYSSFRMRPEQLEDYVQTLLRLRERYGDAALSILTKNPWLLSMDENGVSFALTDRIAMSMGFPPDCEQRVQAALIFMLNFQERNGHVFLPERKLIDATIRTLDS